MCTFLHSVRPRSSASKLPWPRPTPTPQACQEPEAAADGMGGTYFFRHEGGSKVAIFKPCDVSVGACDARGACIV